MRLSKLVRSKSLLLGVEKLCLVGRTGQNQELFQPLSYFPFSKISFYASSHILADC